ncbi:MAG TPA: Na+/H+ antiporter [Myxococcota bacterium]|nr:Na+/H+ antiporter [Myxococcota bacterium]
MNAPETLQIVLVLLGAVLLAMSAARRLPIPNPVMLVLAGLLVSAVPGLPTVRLDPDLVFFVFLPPVLWAAAYFTSLRDFRANARPITLLAVGLVVATAGVVAVAVHTAGLGFGWPAAVALGAIVAPPDAVSATSVVRALGVPRRIVTILEGESLVNDATALILYRAAVLAMMAGSFNLAESLLTFVFAATVGVAIGAAIGWLAAFSRRHIEDVPTQTLLALMAPYLAWILGERLHASAVLACVAGGLVVRRTVSGVDVAPSVRLQARPVWELVLFAINGVLFLLIGLQLRGLVESVAPGGLPTLVGEGLVVSAVVIAIRLVWVPFFAWLPRRLSARLRERDPMPSWQTMFLIGWTGLRGIVSLAAAMALPLALPDGSPLPYRTEIVLITFVVIFCTLVLQGLSLAPLIHWLELPVDDEALREEVRARSHAAQSALDRLESLAGEPWADPRAIGALREQYQDRLRRACEGASNLLAERGAKRARFESLRAERLALLELRNEDVISDEVLLTLEAELDLEAARNGLAELRRAETLAD